MRPGGKRDVVLMFEVWVGYPGVRAEQARSDAKPPSKELIAEPVEGMPLTTEKERGVKSEAWAEQNKECKELEKSRTLVVLPASRKSYNEKW